MLKFLFSLNINFTLLTLCILRFSLPVSAIRKDVSLHSRHNCRTTVHGRFFLTDDNGHVCDALSIDPLSRCCPGKGDQFSCQGCNLVSQCCNSYEFCVSCCLNPATTHKDLALKVKIAKPVTAGTYETVFDFCAGRCRHNSESVVHENAYLSEFHHCFSMSSNSSGSSTTQLETRLAGINVVIGRQGESCDSVCKSNGQSCVPNKLALLNQCEIIQVLVCIQTHNLRFHVMVHIGIQEGFALVHKGFISFQRVFLYEMQITMRSENEMHGVVIIVVPYKLGKLNVLF
ncbi:hypothetical protein ACJIZ3_018023 [Penstemon smallii]|uniref:SREBP regulating gene protein n=1 Tax=Penstemon smallii TaxID=265156 RepID=A0ABD3SX57_9LAMI